MCIACDEGDGVGGEDLPRMEFLESLSKKVTVCKLREKSLFRVWQEFDEEKGRVYTKWEFLFAENK